jgi:hypothetical protein
MALTVEFQLENPSESVNNFHMFSAFAWIFVSTLELIEKVFFTCANSISFVSMILSLFFEPVNKSRIESGKTKSGKK